MLRKCEGLMCYSFCTFDQLSSNSAEKLLEEGSPHPNSALGWLLHPQWEDKSLEQGI